MRLIDADALIDFIDCGHLRNPLESCFSERDVVDMLESRPTIDAVPVARGEWKLYGNDDDSGMSYWCTACNFQLSEDLFYSGYKNGRWIENGVFKYCPNCGAKMEGKQDE
jgi:hypothetical protein